MILSFPFPSFSTYLEPSSFHLSEMMAEFAEEVWSDAEDMSTENGSSWNFRQAMHPAHFFKTFSNSIFIYSILFLLPLYRCVLQYHIRFLRTGAVNFLRFAASTPSNYTPIALNKHARALFQRYILDSQSFISSHLFDSNLCVPLSISISLHKAFSSKTADLTLPVLMQTLSALRYESYLEPGSLRKTMRSFYLCSSFSSLGLISSFTYLQAKMAEQL